MSEREREYNVEVQNKQRKSSKQIKYSDREKSLINETKKKKNKKEKKRKKKTIDRCIKILGVSNLERTPVLGRSSVHLKCTLELSPW